MENGTVYKENGRNADLVDLKAYREQKLEILANEAVRQTAQNGGAEWISQEESRKRRAIRTHINAMREPLKPLPLKCRAGMLLISALLGMLMLFSSQSGKSILPNLFVAVALLIPLLFEKQNLLAFLSFTISLSAAALSFGLSETTLIFFNFGLYAIVRNAVAERFPDWRENVLKAAVLVMSTALLIISIIYFMDQPLFTTAIPKDMPAWLYRIVFGAIVFAIVCGLECFLACVWRIYGKNVHPVLLKHFCDDETI